MLDRWPALSDEERGTVMLILWAHSLVYLLVQAGTAAVLVRAARRGWRQRRLGPVRAARAAVTPALGWAAAANAAYHIGRIQGVHVLDSWLAAHPLPSEQEN